jgi:hypothetical protein
MTPDKLTADTDTCPRCGRFGIFGYHNQEGALIWYCAGLLREGYNVTVRADSALADHLASKKRSTWWTSRSAPEQA